MHLCYFTAFAVGAKKLSQFSSEKTGESSDRIRLIYSAWLERIICLFAASVVCQRFEYV
jgi:hypothetical protein